MKEAQGHLEGNRIECGQAYRKPDVEREVERTSGVPVDERKIFLIS